MIKLKRGTKANMQSENPILSDGQPGYAYDSTGGILKVGDGTTAWNDLMTVANSEWDGTDIPLPVSIVNGGTGADNVVSARENLGFTYGTEAPTGTPSTGEGSIYYQITDEDNDPISIINVVYPVGSLYWTQNSENNPNTMWQGTVWEQIVDKFIYAVNSNSSAGVSGGNNNISLSLENIPSHSHSLSLTSGSTTPSHTVSGAISGGSHTHTWSGSTSSVSHSHRFSATTGGGGAHSHNIYADLDASYTTSGTRSWSVHRDKTSGGTSTGRTTSASNHTHSVSGTTSSGSHSHTVSGTVASATPTHSWSGSVSGGAHTHSISGNTGSTGTGSSFSIMPSYETAYCWKRIS